jgi:PAS domain S-box-containing protein
MKSKRSPLKILLLTVLFVLIIESAVMSLLYFFNCRNLFYYLLINPVILSVCTFIFIYCLIYSPLARFFNENDKKSKTTINELKLYSEIMKNMAEGVYLIGIDDGIIKYCNPKFEKIFGYNPGEMLNKNVALVNAPTDKSPEETAKNIMNIMNKTGEWHGEIQNIKKDGTFFWCNAYCSIIEHSEYGRAIVAVHTDISKIKKVEEELVRIAKETEKANKHAMYMLAVASEHRDTDTGNHIKRIGTMTEKIALELGIKQNEAKQMALDSLLHDLGKIGEADSILLKQEKLTREEFELIKEHTTIGAKIIGNDEWFKQAKEIALFHHEKWDGSGYPQGLKGEEIPLCARIVAIVDVFDASVSKRPYKKAWTMENTVEKIKRDSGKHFDPKVVEAFLSVVSKYEQ